MPVARKPQMLTRFRISSVRREQKRSCHSTRSTRSTAAHAMTHYQRAKIQRRAYRPSHPRQEARSPQRSGVASRSPRLTCQRQQTADAPCVLRASTSRRNRLCCQRVYCVACCVVVWCVRACVFCRGCAASPSCKLKGRRWSTDSNCARLSLPSVQPAFSALMSSTGGIRPRCPPRGSLRRSLYVESTGRLPAVGSAMSSSGASASRQTSPI